MKEKSFTGHEGFINALKTRILTTVALWQQLSHKMKKNQHCPVIMSELFWILPPY